MARHSVISTGVHDTETDMKNYQNYEESICLDHIKRICERIIFRDVVFSCIWLRSGGGIKSKAPESN